MSETKPHIVRLVAEEARRLVFVCGGSQREAPQPRYVNGEFGVLFAEEFIPYAELGYSHDIGFFRLSDADDVTNDAAAYASAGQLIDCGQVIVTSAASQQLSHEDIAALLNRHASGDYGLLGEFFELDVSDEMLQAGVAAAPTQGQANKIGTLTGMNAVTSEYVVDGTCYWVITETGENRSTVILLAGPAPG